MKITVFGGCRFIGYDLALSLVEEGYEVAIVDDHTCPGPTENIHRVRVSPTESEVTIKWVKWADIVYNFYEYDGVNEARINPRKAFKDNVEVVYNILEGFTRSRASRLIHSSTAAVYGEQTNIPIVEDVIKKPVSWYGASKSAAEELIVGFSRERLFDFVILRFFNIYGPGEWNRGNPGVISEFINAVLTGRYIRLEGGGGQIRDFLHVADAVRASIYALQIEPGIYNIGSGIGTSIIDLTRIIMEIHGHPVRTVLADRRPGDIMKSIASIDKIVRETSWKPMVPLEYGVKKLYDYYLGKLS